LVSDNGCQPSSESFLRECRALNIQQIFTSYDNPKGNADTERVIRTIKETWSGLAEWLTVEQLRVALDGGSASTMTTTTLGHRLSDPTPIRSVV